MIYLIDLFSGVGGFSTGFSSAKGTRVILAVDNWKEALQVHKKNHPQCTHVMMTLGKQSEGLILMAVKEALSKNRVPIDTGKTHIHMHASPPCQMITSMNALRNTGEGLKLTRWAFKFISEIFPKFLKQISSSDIRYSWTLEQVSHPKVSQLFSKSSYYHSCLDMSKYGVPQSRTRCLASNFDLLGNLSPSKPPTSGAVLKVGTGAQYLGNSCICPKRWKEQGINCHVRDLKTEVSFTITSHFHWLISKQGKLLRTLTIDENASLQTFPKDYFSGVVLGKSNLARMIGNSIPPVFARKIAEAVKSA